MMKKTVAFLVLVTCAASGKNSDVAELSDSVRESVGRIEYLEKTVAELQKRVVFLEESLEKNQEKVIDQKDASVVENSTPEEILKNALDMIEENDAEGARNLLSAFVKRKPEDIYCGMMMFYIGNTYFIEKDYKNAAIEYMKGFKTNPKGSKSAETLYKLALCFKQLNQKDKYKSTLKKIIDDYPGPFAQKAAAELKKNK
jgi:TolA-binding protein